MFGGTRRRLAVVTSAFVIGALGACADSPEGAKDAASQASLRSSSVATRGTTVLMVVGPLAPEGT